MSIAEYRAEPKSKRGEQEMKRLVITLAIGLLITSLAIPVFARGRGWGMGGRMGGFWGGGPGSCGQPDRGYGSHDPEERNTQDQREEAFYRDTGEIRNQIPTKSAELDTLLNSPNPDLEKARSLQKEISELQAKMDEKRLNHELEERKRNPEARSGRRYGWGSGPHMRGFGSMGGYGPGMGWTH
jgi:Spy/CpxP family protein refolding chaperone